MMRLRTLLGDYPVTRAVKAGDVQSSKIDLDFAEVREPSGAFKRVVRDVEFDVAELAIVTFLIAKSHGIPLTLLPGVVFARFPHPYLVYNPERGPLTPQSLAGRRIGIRSYSVTTVTLIKDILANDHGVDCDSIEWLSTEEPHVAGFVEPPNVSIAPAGKTLVSMLLDGDIDAAILGGKMGDPRLMPLMPNSDQLTSRWLERSRGALPINHMVVVKTSLCRENPDAVREAYRMLLASKMAEQSAHPSALDFNPFGFDAIRPSLEFAIDMTYQQRLIPRRFDLDELFDDVTRVLEA